MKIRASRFIQRLCFLLTLTSIAWGCSESFSTSETDPTPSRGHYYVQNDTEFQLHLEGMTAGEPSFPLPLLQDSVEANSTINFYISEPMPSGIFLPSHIFGRFLIWAQPNGGDTIFYDVVQDGDWDLREQRGGPHYYLPIPLN